MEHMHSAIHQAQLLLKSHFGYEHFRFHQESAIASILNKKDVIVLMPTGGGKSLCYQIPALILEGVTIVVSPLIALMKDQVDALKNNGIPAAFINSTQAFEEQEEILTSVKNGTIKILYIAPERLFLNNNPFVDFLKTIQVALFAIDEAHCISSWGHDFRPDYILLGRLKKIFPQVPIIALTATADKLVRQDIMDKLHIEKAELLISSFNRPNIFYRVEPKRNSYAQLLDYLKLRKNESGIIYCLSRNSVESLAEDLCTVGYQALPYHARLEKEVREKNQDLFLKDEAKIIVATIAFGMGIDKSNVRFVVHCDVPKNIESYYQETGRAGRDGLPSEALLFFSWGDIIKLKKFAEVEGNETQSEIMLNKLNLMGKFAEIKSCRRKYLLNYFSETFLENCGNCDNCNAVHERFDGTTIAQKALSAVHRTGQRFGLTYLVDFLRGSQSQKLWDEHKYLKTFGIGKDISKDHWFHYFRDLIDQGFLRQVEGTYPTIALTEKSKSVLFDKIQVQLIKPPHKKEKETLHTRAPLEYDQELFELLKGERTIHAQKENMPAYIIFSDASLVEMAMYLPQSIQEFQKISGVGIQKLEKYGNSFVSLIQNYCRKHGLASRIEEKIPKRERKIKTQDGTKMDSHEISLSLFKAGVSIEDIAIQRNFTRSTIENHLVRFISTGEVQLTDLVPTEKIPSIRQAILETDELNALAHIKKKLGDSFSYGEICAVIESLKITSA